MKMAHSLLIPYQMILEAVPMSICTRFRFRKILVFDQNQDIEYLWYDFKQLFYHYLKRIVHFYLDFITWLCTLLFH